MAEFFDLNLLVILGWIFVLDRTSLQDECCCCVFCFVIFCEYRSDLHTARERCLCYSLYIPFTHLHLRQVISVAFKMYLYHLMLPKPLQPLLYIQKYWHNYILLGRTSSLKHFFLRVIFLHSHVFIHHSTKALNSDHICFAILSKSSLIMLYYCFSHYYFAKKTLVLLFLLQMFLRSAHWFALVLCLDNKILVGTAIYSTNILQCTQRCSKFW